MLCTLSESDIARVPIMTGCRVMLLEDMKIIEFTGPNGEVTLYKDDDEYVVSAEPVHDTDEDRAVRERRNDIASAVSLFLQKCEYQK